jgi:hypothetical protein
VVMVWMEGDDMITGGRLAIYAEHRRWNVASASAHVREVYLSNNLRHRESSGQVVQHTSHWVCMVLG